MSVTAGQIMSELDDQRLARIKELTKQRAALVAACRAAYDYFDDRYDGEPGQMAVVYDQLRAALAAVEEQG